MFERMREKITQCTNFYNELKSDKDFSQHKVSFYYGMDLKI